MSARPVSATACVELTGRVHSLFVCVLLIASGIQSVTPDSRNLASLNVFRVLCFTTDGSMPDQDSNDQPDEVSGPVHSTQKRHRLTLMLSTTISEVAFTQFTALALAHNASFRGSGRDEFIRRDGLISQFYHIRC